MNQNNILIYVQGWFLHFGIAKALQSKIDNELYAIIDFGDKARKFFDEQKIVDYKKIWHYNDAVNDFQINPDIEYLKSIEKKYDINLWNIAYTDKSFNLYNEFHQFSTNEILSILEQECRFFEKILEESQPKFFLTYHTQNHYQYLLYMMCKAKGIKVLMLSPAKLAKKFFVSEDGVLLDDEAYENTKSTIKFENENEAKEYFKKFDTQSYIANARKISFESNLWERYKYVLKYFVSDNSAISKQYSYYGMTKSKVLSKKIERYFKRKRRKSFIDKYFKTELPNDSPFVYFPLHYEPERVLLVSAPYFSNQLAIISNIAKSIPINYKLIVKENPSQGTIGWRDTSYYKSIINLPNVELLHPSIKSHEILSKCSLVVTIAGTAGFEAAFYNKPTIILSEQVYSKLPFVIRLKELEKLPQAIKEQLNNKVDFNNLAGFMNVLENNSVDIVLDEYAAEFAYMFGFKGPTMDSELSENKINVFLEKYDKLLNEVAQEHIRKMKLDD